MEVRERILEIENAARQFAYVREVIRVDETDYSVKYRLNIEPDLFVQLYFNERSGTVGMALVFHGQRLYGRDCEAGHWHRHPAHNPAAHDFSPEGVQAVSVEEFLAQVQDVLIETDIT